MQSWMRQFGIASTTDDPAVTKYLSAEQKQLKTGIALEIDGRRVPLMISARRVIFTDGAGGLPTMKIDLTLGGSFPLSSTAHKLSYRDDNFPEFSAFDGSQPGTDELLERCHQQSSATGVRGGRFQDSAGHRGNEGCSSYESGSAGCAGHTSACGHNAGACRPSAKHAAQPFYRAYLDPGPH